MKRRWVGEVEERDGEGGGEVKTGKMQQKRGAAKVQNVRQEIKETH